MVGQPHLGLPECHRCLCNDSKDVAPPGDAESENGLMQRNIWGFRSREVLGGAFLIGIVVLDGFDTGSQWGDWCHRREGCCRGARCWRRKGTIWCGSGVRRQEERIPVGLGPKASRRRGEPVMGGNTQWARLGGVACRVDSGSPKRPVHGSREAGACAAASCAHRQSRVSLTLGQFMSMFCSP
jgi:hypothetical protein